METLYEYFSKTFCLDCCFQNEILRLLCCHLSPWPIKIEKISKYLHLHLTSEQSILITTGSGVEGKACQGNSDSCKWFFVIVKSQSGCENLQWQRIRKIYHGYESRTIIIKSVKIHVNVCFSVVATCARKHFQIMLGEMGRGRTAQVQWESVAIFIMQKSHLHVVSTTIKVIVIGPNYRI